MHNNSKAPERGKSTVAIFLATEQLTAGHFHCPIFCGRVSLFARAANSSDKAMRGECAVRLERAE
jgi:hypothetical protein